MKRIFNAIISMMTSLFGGGRNEKLSRSKLVGMYLSESNHGNRDAMKTRQRRDGSYVQARRP